MKLWHTIYSNLITFENLIESYQEFKREKRKSLELLKFERHLEDNLFSLFKKLKNKTYRPGRYTGFYINDPKVRLIHKAGIKDRVVHHLVSRQLERIFETSFIAHSYACRKNKGTHKGVHDLQRFAWIVGRGNTKTCFALKCDIKRYFASINHDILFRMLSRKIKDQPFLSLLRKIIDSFSITHGKGLPIGNLTSQLFANIYLNELDQFIKHELKVKYYLRYTDDFIILSSNRRYLENLLQPIQTFLKNQLDLDLHPNKIIFLTLQSGIDFLGYVVFHHHILPRTKTKKRLLRKIKNKIRKYKDGEISYDTFYQCVQSYLGFLAHCNSYSLQKKIIDLVKSEVDPIGKKFRALRAKKPRIKNQKLQEPKNSSTS